MRSSAARGSNFRFNLKWKYSRVILLCLSLFVLPLSAAHAATVLEPEKEAEARKLFTELRCVVCQNQSIDSSDADVAKDLREIVREQIAAGKTGPEIKSFLVQRYGEFVLLKPAFAWHTALLWASPLLVLFAGGLLAWRSARGRKAVDAETLSAEEESAVEELLKRE